MKFGVIVDVEATRAIRQAEVGAAKTMIGRTLAMPPVHSLRPKLSSNRAATANASRCCSPISSASCGWVVCGCAGHVARKMSSRSQLSHRTYGGSPNWLLDHHQPMPCVLHNCCGRQYHGVLAALNRADRNGWF